jgi:hypothetical protein
MDYVLLTCTQGTYTVEADVFAANGDRITCLTATVAFNLPRMDFLGGEL